MFSEYPANILSYWNILQFFNDEDIHLQRFFTQQIFFVHLQISHLILQSDTQGGSKGGMPL